MIRVRFVADAVYETEGPGRGRLFRAGEVHDLRPDLAQRWIRRGLAEAVDMEDAAPAAVTISPDDLVVPVETTDTAVTPARPPAKRRTRT